MNVLVDFLNHGALPFVGRSTELERLLRFWRSTPEADTLRAMLLVGEAGIGKSRLVGELLWRIESEGGVAVHVRLLPEATTSLIPLVARALWSSEGGERLLRNQPEESIESVLGALRRIARLRPTLLVIEDAHLLERGNAHELSQLLEGLADETLSVLCTKRPIEGAVRGLLARYLIEELELQGLDEHDLTELWKAIFSETTEQSMVAALTEASAGNPLAVRAALRGAVASGAIALIGDVYRTRLDRTSFTREMKRNIDTLGEGLAAHITEDELHSARALSQLGEAFAREAARRMVDNADMMIDRLIFKGVLTTLATSLDSIPYFKSDDVDVGIVPASNSPLLSFTHSLLHRYLVEHKNVDATRVAAIVGSDAPLYSQLPFQMLSQRLDDVVASPTNLSEVFNRARALHALLFNTLGPERSEHAREIARSFFERFQDHWTEPERASQELRLRLTDISVARSWIGSTKNDADEYYRLAASLLEKTSNPRTPNEALWRLHVIPQACEDELNDFHSRRRIWDEVEEIVSAFPEVRFRFRYRVFLSTIASKAVNLGDHAMVHVVEKRFREIESQVEGGIAMQLDICPSLLPVFDTEEELKERLGMLHELELLPMSDIQLLCLMILRLQFYDDIGDVDGVFETLNENLARFRSFGYGSALLMQRLPGLIALGVDLQTIDRMTDEIMADTPAGLHGTVDAYLSSHASEAALLRGDMEWARSNFARCPEGDNDIHPALMLMLGDRLPENTPELEARGYAQALFDLMTLRQCSEGSMDVDSVAGAVTRILGRPLLRVSDISMLYATMKLLASENCKPVAAGAKKSIQNALQRGLEWLAQHRLAAYMHSLLEHADGYLNSREIRGWRSRRATIQRERDAQLSAARGDGRIALTMLGTIAIQHPDKEPEKVSGERLRAVLGLMVANQLLEKPLSHREFCGIATGEDDPDRARNVVYVRLHRLRELLGPDAIVTETEDAPRLNRKRLRIDLLDLHEHIGEARAALRRGMLLRGYSELHKALEIWGGDVAFPGLYEEFFEAAREDLENALRQLLLRVASQLLQEEDAENAERLLRRAYEAIPDDEEVSALLQQALTQSGKRVEAERIRRAMQAEEA